MKLPIPFLKTKKEKSDYYLALIVTDEKVGALILKADDGVLKRVNSNEVVLPESIEELAIDDLISAVDKAISRAEEILPPDIQTHQTIFGVKESWVDNETKKIKKEYLDKLKKVCNAVDLTPIGFMVTTEAIAHLIQEEEGAPLSAIVAEIGKKYITLSLLRGGKVLESVSSPHLESTPATIDKLLGHFTVPVLPARMVVFQSKHDERTSQALTTHQWSKHLPFLHVPQVTVLPDAFDLRSVMFGAATQMGFTVLESAHEELPKSTPPTSDEEAFASEEQIEGAETSQAPLDLGKSAEEAEADEAAASDFGFVVDQDIADRKPAESPEVQQEEPYHHALHGETLDNVQEPDFSSSRRQKQSEEENGPSLSDRLASVSFMKNFKLTAVSEWFAGLTGKNATIRKFLPIGIGALAILFIILFYFFGMKANVKLTLKPNLVNQDETVTFSTSKSNDFSNNLISAKSVSTSIDAQVSTAATGKKDVGDKAKGTITIYNNSDSSVSLSSGSTLTASNGQVFTLDNSVTVASASGDIFSGTKPGTSNATVTAKDIGTDGNVPSGTKFTIGSGNTVAAKNDNAFSGGSKKSVTVVSSNDLAKLRSDIVKSVQDSAKQKLETQASSGETVLPLISNPVLENQKFDKHSNDQASQVSLTASVVFTGMAYENSDLDDYAKSVVKEKYPQNPNLANKSVKETVADAKQRTQDAATATVTVQAGLLPNIDQQDVINNVKDKSLGDAKRILMNLPQVDDASITFSPPIPLLPYLFPRLPNHISIIMSSQ